MPNARRPKRLFNPDELAALQAMTEDEVVSNAQADLENPPLSDAQLRRMRIACRIRLTRQAAGDLSQAAFARTFHISPGRLKDAEQGRHDVDPILVNYIALIADDPERAKRVLATLKPS